ncbi:MAG: HDOD domain-containing protein [Bdellovibrionales bacterium]|nr:HDOD domain-containing protein [Bdellovibrionales bacterium]
MSTHSSWIEKIQSLPVLPQIAMRVTERMQSPTATLSEISDLIKSDVGLSTKVLRLANSSYYSIPGGVSEVSKALHYLGFTTIAQIVLTSSVFGSFKTQGIREFPLAPFWMHSFAVGQLAEMTARTLQLENPSDSFVGGLIHDVGKLILLETAPEHLARIVRLAKEKKLSFLAAERELGDSTHVDLGLELAKHWKLPPGIQKAIQFHHSGLSDRSCTLIQWANLRVNFRNLGNSGNHDPGLESIMVETQTRLGLGSRALEALEIHFQKEFEKAGAILSGH